MELKSMTRKDFIKLTFTLVGGAAGVAACSSSSNGSSDGGTGGNNGNLCTSPLPETMEPDQTMHTHTLTVGSALLNQQSDQTITTSGIMNAATGIQPHTHTVVLTAANLGVLKGGGSVMVTSMVADDPAPHVHTFQVSCTAATGAGGAGGNGTGGAGGLGFGGNGGAGAVGIGGAGGI
ncbi:MAG TPA: hypothetical protein VHF26_00860 [Trebonia sp.]|nr:hypothetical protein [Trebonia sp.]